MSEFDRDCITYTQEGRILQLEYANKAVENAEYPYSNLGPLSASNARMESFLELKNSCFRSYWSTAPIPASSTSTSISAWLSMVRFPMANIL